MEFTKGVYDALGSHPGSIENGRELGRVALEQIRAHPEKCEDIVNAIFDQVSQTSKDAQPSASSLEAIKFLSTELTTQVEAVICHRFNVICEAGSHKHASVRSEAEACASTFVSHMNKHCVRELLPALFSVSKVGSPWQSRAMALRIIASFGEHAPAQLGNALPEVVPHVTLSMNEPKKEVSAAAFSAMTNACNVIGNRDIEHMTTKIVRCILNPDETPEIMHDLAGVTFVQSVESPALAMVVPLLIRGLRSKLTATRRQSAVIIDNMSKLVDHPIDAEPFLPTLLPDLVFAAENMSDPEARNVAERATKQLNRLKDQCEFEKSHSEPINEKRVEGLLREKLGCKSGFNELITHMSWLCCSLMHMRQFDKKDWREVSEFFNYLLSRVNSSKLSQKDALIEEIREAAKEMVAIHVDEEEEEDDAEELCNCQFTLAYGTKILLHNTTMRLKRGAKYGLLGGNESGKTTLMRKIAEGAIEGFPSPSEVRTVFVEADILGELSHLSCVDYIMNDPRLKNASREEVLGVMATVGFTEDGKAKPNHPVSSLSGGWRMKLALARAMLQKADILLLDEPTNHLDVINVAWVKNYINSLKNVTAIMVSHDSGFLNDCCTDILQIENLKLHHFRGNLDKFIAVNPEARAYFSIKESKLKFKFPQPGPIEGVKSRSKALMKMAHCYFTYPGNTTPTLFDITIQVSMASRVGCVGENGAGKSTMIKVLTGEVVPQQGEVWKHPNCRVAYVAQHAFHHIENHLNKTANEYIRWRYSNGEDKESLVKVSMQLTDEEARLQKEPFEVSWVTEDGKQQRANKVIVEFLGARRELRGREYEYEVKFRDGSEMFLSQRVLASRGWEKSCRAIDARMAQRSGLQLRALSSANVEAHLADCGLSAEFATHYRIGALSGGQKVKVVLAAAMWNQPHIIILDEPTNYLDRESLGALAGAIQDYQGGVVIISHNNEFVSQLCPEEWVMDSGHLTTRGEVGWMSRQDDKISDQVQLTEIVDALGNVTEVEPQKKTMSKRDEKAFIKAIQKKIKAGGTLDDEEAEFADAHGLDY